MKAATRFQRDEQDEMSIEPFDGTVTVSFTDAVIASTDRAKVLHERGHEPVLYIPFDDIYFEFLEKTNSSSHCPLKGDAGYWRVSAVGQAAEDFMWAYETPIPRAAAIARHGAFDPDAAVIEAVPSGRQEHPIAL